MNIVSSIYKILMAAALLLFLSLTKLQAYNPLPPLLEIVTVNNETSSAILTWTAGSSEGVTGYVVYRYRNNEGYAIDTIHDPNITTYTDYGTGALFFSESYVVAALATDDEISPLSNPVGTIFLTAVTDTCNLTINLNWNRFFPGHSEVTGYEVLIAKNGSDFTTLTTTGNDVTEYHYSDFEIDTQYHFLIKAQLANGQKSLSNRVSLTTNIQRPPDWIEAKHVTSSGGEGLEIEVTYDPLSETEVFRIERREYKDAGFETVTEITSTGGNLIYHDTSADNRRRYLYRVAAINNCNNSVLTTNEFGNIVLENRGDTIDMELTWNKYRGWDDGVDKYEVLWGSGKEPPNKLLSVSQPTDTILFLSYSDIMYSIAEETVCFTIKAVKTVTTTEAVSVSNSFCIDAIERVTIPTAFTPGSGDRNELFSPVLSFTPSSYYLVIRAGSGRILFETDTPYQSWDGTANGERLSPGVYLWFLSTTTPSGKVIVKRGTVALIYN